MIPFLGPFLQGLTGPLILAISGIYGANFETENSMYKSAMILAENFFKLFAEIFNGIKEYWESR
jgi:hypothetical protein